MLHANVSIKWEEVEVAKCGDKRSGKRKQAQSGHRHTDTQTHRHRVAKCGDKRSGKSKQAQSPHVFLRSTKIQNHAKCLTI